MTLFLWQAVQGSRPTRRHPRDYPREDVGVGVVKCGLYRRADLNLNAYPKLTRTFQNLVSSFLVHSVLILHFFLENLPPFQLSC